MTNLERRVRDLEARIVATQVTLYFADGKTRHICGDTSYLIDLLILANGRHELSPRQAEDLDLIRRCIASKEANGGHMIELIQCLMDGEDQARNSEIAECDLVRPS